MIRCSGSSRRQSGERRGKSWLSKHAKTLPQSGTPSQLREIGEIFQSDVCQSIIPNIQEWDRFIQRAERLQSYVQLLRENMTQLRELFQSVQDARQNRIMGIITIITTVFFPLSLLTGWYGMNFVNMPELQWEYSYFVMIFVVIVIVTAEIIYFKKKKFF